MRAAVFLLTVAVPLSAAFLPTPAVFSGISSRKAGVSQVSMFGGTSNTKTVAVSGSTGLVGKALVQSLTKSGYTVKPLSRKGGKLQVTPEDLEGLDCVYHLAGESIATGSGPLGALGVQAWSDGKKAEILRSRVEGTKAVVDAINACKKPPKALVCASAVGLYGYTSGEKVMTETSPQGSGFLAEVVRSWEQEANKAKCRVVNTRFGVILSKESGALAKLLPIFQVGGGGIVGSGQQYFPWVSLRDIVSALEFAGTKNLQGPYNVNAPGVVTNAEFTSALGEAISRPTILPFPEFAAKLLFGQMGEEVLLGGQNVSPKKLQAAGFKFQDEDIKSGIKSALQ